MTDMDDFTERERALILGCVKPRRHDSEEMYDLYEKVSDWRDDA